MLTLLKNHLFIILVIVIPILIFVSIMIGRYLLKDCDKCKETPPPPSVPVNKYVDFGRFIDRDDQPRIHSFYNTSGLAADSYKTDVGTLSVPNHDLEPWCKQLCSDDNECAAYDYYLAPGATNPICKRYKTGEIGKVMYTWSQDDYGTGNLKKDKNPGVEIYNYDGSGPPAMVL